MAHEISIDQLRPWIGRQEHESDIVTPALEKRFRATLANYTQLDAAALPLGIHWCLAQPALSSDKLGSDGHPAKGGFLPPVPLPRRMWAASSITFHAAPDVGEAVEKTSTIVDVELKQSEASGALVFVHIDHQCLQGSKLLIEERQTLVYRKASAFTKPKPQQPVDFAHSMKIVPDATLLFRYSALTFNGHRIHYDSDYATAVEAYPALVVQGPLMATLLMNMAQAQRPDAPLRTFKFRGMAPAFVDQPLELLLLDNGAETLELRNNEGALVMAASAGF